MIAPGSAIYRGHLMHHRYGAVENRFRYPVYFLALDLAELDTLASRLRLFSRNRHNLHALWDRDYEGAAACGIQRSVRRFIHERGGPDDITRIVLVTQARVLGYVFNPVSFHMCYRASGELACAVAEVHNNFDGRHRYLLDPRTQVSTRRGTAYLQDKEFFVSPFIHDAKRYEFRFHTTEQRYDVHMNVCDEAGGLILVAHLGGIRHALGDRALAEVSVRYPLMTLQVTAKIHWQALRLWARGLQYRRPAGYQSRFADLRVPGLLRSALFQRFRDRPPS